MLYLFTMLTLWECGQEENKNGDKEKCDFCRHIKNCSQNKRSKFHCRLPPSSQLRYCCDTAALNMFLESRKSKLVLQNSVQTSTLRLTLHCNSGPLRQRQLVQHSKPSSTLDKRPPPDMVACTQTARSTCLIELFDAQRSKAERALL